MGIEPTPRHLNDNRKKNDAFVYIDLIQILKEFKSFIFRKYIAFYIEIGYSLYICLISCTIVENNFRINLALEYCIGIWQLSLAIVTFELCCSIPIRVLTNFIHK